MDDPMKNPCPPPPRGNGSRGGTVSGVYRHCCAFMECFDQSVPGQEEGVEVAGKAVSLLRKNGQTVSSVWGLAPLRQCKDGV